MNSKKGNKTKIKRKNSAWNAKEIISVDLREAELLGRSLGQTIHTRPLFDPGHLKNVVPFLNMFFGLTPSVAEDLMRRDIVFLFLTLRMMCENESTIVSGDHF